MVAYLSAVEIGCSDVSIIRPLEELLPFYRCFKKPSELCGSLIMWLIGLL